MNIPWQNSERMRVKGKSESRGRRRLQFLLLLIITYHRWPQLHSTHLPSAHIEKQGSPFKMATTSISKTERSYIQSSLQANPPLRADGRSLLDYRTVFLETGVAPLANGSAKLNIGKSPQEGGGGTEILAATKLEVEDVETGDGVDGGRLVCTVTWCVLLLDPAEAELRSSGHLGCVSDPFKDSSPSAYPNLSSNALEELQYDLTTILHQALAHPELHPCNLGILPRKKAWLLSVDLVVLSDGGNTPDALFMAARAALWDTRVPRTRPIQYQVRRGGGANSDAMEVDGDPAAGTGSAFDTRDMKRDAADFEVPDYWDEGEVLDGRDRWPVCVTLNLVGDSPSCCVVCIHRGCHLYSSHQHISWMQLPRKKSRHLSNSCWRSPSRRTGPRVCRLCA